MRQQIAVTAVAARTNVATPSTRSIRQRIDEVLRFVDAQWMTRKYEPGWFEKVERELHSQIAGLERDLTAEIMEAHDVDAAAIEVEGQAHRCVLRAAQTSTSQALESRQTSRWVPTRMHEVTSSGMPLVGHRIGTPFSDVPEELEWVAPASASPEVSVPRMCA